jgi:hypothetical protein
LKQEEAILSIYRELCTANNTTTDEQAFLKFTVQLLGIASEIQVVPRAEQLAIMFLLLTSTSARSFIQLVTGFGKAVMFSLMSRYYNIFQQVKMAVAVPTDVLAAIHQ